MTRTALLVAGLLLFSTTATAGPNWQTISFSITPANFPKVMKAMDKLLSSSADDLTGTVSLMANVAGGEYSHSIISSFDSRAAREKWTQGLRTSPAWSEFASATAGLLEARGSSRMDFVKSWGKENAKDVFWEIYAFTVTDAAAFSAAIDGLMASGTGKKFPGQVRLSAVAASGISPVTHLISVGFESEAEAETWNDSMITTKDWASYQKASEAASSFAGAFLTRTIKTWGNAGD
jgi:hypothetical protein